MIMSLGNLIILLTLTLGMNEVYQEWLLRGKWIVEKVLVCNHLTFRTYTTTKLATVAIRNPHYRHITATKTSSDD